MPASTTIIITGLIFIAAALYATVGHAGASAYLAVMGLFSLAPDIMKPTALALNILVAVIGTFKFWRAGHFSWGMFWPFAAASIPFAFIGGALTLPGDWYKIIVGLVLLYAAYRLFFIKMTTLEREDNPPPLWASLLIGAGIGLLSGLTGVGGGIFLSPILLLAGWAGTKRTSAIAAAFILVNSIAGLLGRLSSVALLPAQIPYWGAAAVLGGWIGAEYGSKRLANPLIRKLLAVVLVIGGVKMAWPLADMLIAWSKGLIS